MDIIYMIEEELSSRYNEHLESEMNKIIALNKFQEQAQESKH